jgi:hypothetical protein
MNSIVESLSDVEFIQLPCGRNTWSLERFLIENQGAAQRAADFIHAKNMVQVPLLRVNSATSDHDFFFAPSIVDGRLDDRAPERHLEVGPVQGSRSWRRGVGDSDGQPVQTG